MILDDKTNSGDAQGLKHQKIIRLFYIAKKKESMNRKLVWNYMYMNPKTGNSDIELWET